MTQAPKKIEHLVEHDPDPNTGEVSYYYNFLLYTFDTSAGPVIARSYLDTIDEVSILNSPDGAGIEKEMVGILAFLRLRYRTVKRLSAKGRYESL